MASNSVTTYLSNVLQSVKFAAIEVFNEQMPISTGFVKQNKEVAKQMFKDILEARKDLIKVGNLQDNVVFKKANQFYKNLKEDLKTGTFYHEDRGDPMEMMNVISSLGDGMGEGFGDIAKEMQAMFSGNFDFDDEEEEGEAGPSYEDRPELMISKGDALVASALFKSQARSSNCIGNVIAEVHEHDVMDRRAAYSMQFQQAERMTMINQAGWTSMVEGFNHIIEFNNEVMRTHAQNSQKFYEEMLKTAQETNNSIKEIGDIYKKVNRLQIEAEKTGEDDPEKENINYSELFKNGLNLQLYQDIVTKRVAKTELAQILNLSKLIPMMLGTFVENPLHLLTKSIIKGIIGGQLMYAMKRFDQIVENSIRTGLAKLYDYGKKAGSGIKGTIASVLGFKEEQQDLSVIDTSKYNKDTMTWNGIAQKALVEVIPGYLSRIEASLTGTGERYYDFNKGKWSNIDRIKEELDKLNESLMNTTLAPIQDKVNQMKGMLARAVKNGSITEEKSKEIEEALFKKALQGITRRGYLDFDDMIANPDNYGGSKYINWVREFYKSVEHNKQIAMTGSIASANRSRNESLARGSESGNVLGRLIDNSMIGTVNRKKGFNPELGSLPPMLTDLTALRDKRGKTLYDYQDLILMELYKIRNQGGMLAGYVGGDITPPSEPPSESTSSLPPNYRGPRATSETKTKTPEEREKELEEKYRATIGGNVEAEEQEKPHMSELEKEIAEQRKREFEAKEEAKKRTLKESGTGLSEDKVIDYFNEKFEGEEGLGKETKDASGKIVYTEGKIFEHFIKYLNDTEKTNRDKQTKKNDDGFFGSFFKFLHGNLKPETYHKLPEGVTSDMSFLDQLLKAGDMGQKFDVIRHNIDALRDAPAAMLSGVLAKAEESIYNMLFTKEAGVDSKGKPIHGLFEKMLSEVTKKANESDSFFNSIIKKIKNLFSEDGLLGFVGGFIKENAGIDLGGIKDDISKSGSRFIRDAFKGAKAAAEETIHSGTKALADAGFIDEKTWRVNYGQKFSDIGERANERLKLEAADVKYANKQFDSLTDEERELLAKNKYDMSVIPAKEEEKKEEESTEVVSEEEQETTTPPVEGAAYGLDSLQKKTIAVSPGEAYISANGKEVIKNIPKYGFMNVNPGDTIVNANQNPFNPRHGKEDLFKQSKMEQQMIDNTFANKNTVLQKLAKNSITGYAEGGQVTTQPRKTNLIRRTNSGRKSRDDTNRLVQEIANSGFSADEINRVINALEDDRREVVKEIVKAHIEQNPQANIRDQKEMNRELSQSLGKLVGILSNTIDNQHTFRLISHGVEEKDGVVQLGSNVNEKAVATRLGSYANMGQMSYKNSDLLRETLEETNSDNLVKSDEEVDRYNITQKQSPLAGFREFMAQAVGTDPKKAAVLTKDYMMENMFHIGKGGALGALLSLVFPLGGPLMGAMVGAGFNMLRRNDTLNEYLFGKVVTDENGKSTRDNSGLFSRKTVEAFQKYWPDAKKYGAIGAVAGLITPFGPLGGAMIGAGASIVRNNYALNQMLFGESGGLLNKDRKAKLKKALPHIGLATLSTFFLGPFGILGSAAVGTALGLFSTSEMFKKLMLGPKDRDGVRRGGLAGVLRRQITDPFKETMDEVKKNLGTWFKDKIFGPISRGLEPLARVAISAGRQGMTKFFEGLSNFITGRMSGFLPKFVVKWMNRAFGFIRRKGALGKYLIKKLASPLEGIASFVEGAGKKVEEVGVRKGFLRNYSATQAAEVYDRMGDQSVAANAARSISGIKDQDKLEALNESIGQLADSLKGNFANRIGQMQNRNIDVFNGDINQIIDQSNLKAREKASVSSWVAETANEDTFKNIFSIANHKKRTEAIRGLMGKLDVPEEIRKAIAERFMSAVETYGRNKSLEDETVRGTYLQPLRESIKQALGLGDMSNEELDKLLTSGGVGYLVSNEIEARKKEEWEKNRGIQEDEGKKSLKTKRKERREKLKVAKQKVKDGKYEDLSREDIDLLREAGVETEELDKRDELLTIEETEAAESKFKSKQFDDITEREAKLLKNKGYDVTEVEQKLEEKSKKKEEETPTSESQEAVEENTEAIDRQTEALLDNTQAVIEFKDRLLDAVKNNESLESLKTDALLKGEQRRSVENMVAAQDVNVLFVKAQKKLLERLIEGMPQYKATDYFDDNSVTYDNSFTGYLKGALRTGRVVGNEMIVNPLAAGASVVGDIGGLGIKVGNWAQRKIHLLQTANANDLRIGRYDDEKALDKASQDLISTTGNTSLLGRLIPQAMKGQDRKDNEELFRLYRDATEKQRGIVYQNDNGLYDSTLSWDKLFGKPGKFTTKNIYNTLKDYSNPQLDKVIALAPSEAARNTVLEVVNSIRATRAHENGEIEGHAFGLAGLWNLGKAALRGIGRFAKKKATDKLQEMKKQAFAPYYNLKNKYDKFKKLTQDTKQNVVNGWEYLKEAKQKYYGENFEEFQQKLENLPEAAQNWYNEKFGDDIVAEAEKLHGKEFWEYYEALPRSLKDLIKERVIQKRQEETDKNKPEEPAIEKKEQEDKPLSQEEVKIDKAPESSLKEMFKSVIDSSKQSLAKKFLENEDKIVSGFNSILDRFKKKTDVPPSKEEVEGHAFGLDGIVSKAIRRVVGNEEWEELSDLGEDRETVMRQRASELANVAKDAHQRYKRMGRIRRFIDNYKSSGAQAVRDTAIYRANAYLDSLDQMKQQQGIRAAKQKYIVDPINKVLEWTDQSGIQAREALDKVADRTEGYKKRILGAKNDLLEWADGIQGRDLLDRATNFVDDKSKTIRDKVSSLKQTLGDRYDSARTKITELRGSYSAEQALDWLQDKKDQASEAWQNTKNYLGDKYDSVRNRISELRGSYRDNKEAARAKLAQFKDTLLGKKQGITEWWNTKKDQASQTLEDASEFIGNKKQQASEAIENVTTQFKDKKQALSEWVQSKRDSTSQTIDKAKDSIGDTRQRISDSYSDISSKLNEKREALSEWVKSQKYEGSKALESVFSFLNEKKQSVLESFDKGKQFLLDRKEDLKALSGKFNDLTSLVIDKKNSIIGSISNRIDQVSSLMIEKRDAIRSFFKDKKNGLANIEDSISSKLNNMTSFFTDKKNSIVNVIGDRLGQIASVMNEKRDAIKNFFKDKKTDIKNIKEAISSKIDNIKEFISGGKGSLTNVITERIGEISSFITEKTDAIKEFFKDKKTGVKNIKEAISSKIDNIKQFFSGGMGSAIKGFIDDKKQLLSDKWDQAKEWIGSKSTRGKEAIERIGSFISDKKQKVKDTYDKIIDTKDRFHTALSGGKEGILNFLKEQKDQWFKKKEKPQYKETTTTREVDESEVPEWAKRAFETGEGLQNGEQAAAGSQHPPLKEMLKTILSRKKDEFLDSLADKKDNLMAFIRSSQDSIKKAFDLYNSISDRAATKLDEIVSSLKVIVKALVPSFRSTDTEQPVTVDTSSESTIETSEETSSNLPVPIDENRPLTENTFIQYIKSLKDVFLNKDQPKTITTPLGDVITMEQTSDGSWNQLPTKDNIEAQSKLDEQQSQQERQTTALETLVALAQGNQSKGESKEKEGSFLDIIKEFLKSPFKFISSMLSGFATRLLGPLGKGLIGAVGAIGSGIMAGLKGVGSVLSSLGKGVSSITGSLLNIVMKNKKIAAGLLGLGWIGKKIYSLIFGDEENEESTEQTDASYPMAEAATNQEKLQEETEEQVSADIQDQEEQANPSSTLGKMASSFVGGVVGSKLMERAGGILGSRAGQFLGGGVGATLAERAFKWSETGEFKTEGLVSDIATNTAQLWAFDKIAGKLSERLGFKKAELSAEAQQKRLKILLQAAEDNSNPKRQLAAVRKLKAIGYDFGSSEEGKVAKFIDKAKEGLQRFKDFANSVLPESATKKIEEFITKLNTKLKPDAIKSALKNAGKSVLAALSTPVGMAAVTIAFFAKSFYDNYEEADSLFDVPKGKSTTSMKVLAGLAGALPNIIPGVGILVAAVWPTEWVLEQLVSTIGPILGVNQKDIDQLRGTNASSETTVSPYQVSSSPTPKGTDTLKADMSTDSPVFSNLSAEEKQTVTAFINNGQTMKEAMFAIKMKRANAISSKIDEITPPVTIEDDTPLMEESGQSKYGMGTLEDRLEQDAYDKHHSKPIISSNSLLRSNQFVSMNTPMANRIDFTNPGERRFSQTAMEAACGPATIVNTAAGQGIQLNPLESIEKAKRSKERGGGTPPSEIKEQLSNAGLETKQLSGIQDAKDAIRDHKSIAIMGRYGSANPHWMSITGASKDGKYAIVQDSDSRRPNRLYDLEDTLKNSTYMISAGRSKSGRSKYGMGPFDPSNQELLKRTDFAWAWLTSEGKLSKQGAAAAIGNMLVESGDLDPQRVEYGVPDPETGKTYGPNDRVKEVTDTNMTIDPGQPGYGIFQFTSPGLKKDLADYAKSKNISSGTIQAQLGAWQYTNTEGAASFRKPYFEQMKTTESPEELARIWCEKLEVPNPEYAHLEDRMAGAQEAYEYYKDKTLTNVKDPTGGNSVSSSSGSSLSPSSNQSSSSNMSPFEKAMQLMSLLINPFAAMGSSSSQSNTSSSTTQQTQQQIPSGGKGLSRVTGQTYDIGEPMGQVTRISVHHTGSDTTPQDEHTVDPSAAEIDAMHRAQGYAGIGYHYVIRKDGSIEHGRAENRMGAHTLGANPGSIGIHVGGNFEVGKPTDKQLSSLSTLIKDVSNKYNIPIDSDHIKTHSQWTPGETLCAGTNLNSIMDSVISKAAGTTGRSKYGLGLEEPIIEEEPIEVEPIDEAKFEREAEKQLETKNKKLVQIAQSAATSSSSDKGLFTKIYDALSKIMDSDYIKGATRVLFGDGPNPLSNMSLFGQSKYGKGNDIEERKQYTWDWLTDATKGGLNTAAAAGIMANMDTESGGTFDPTIVEGGGTSPTSEEAPRGYGYGIVQYTDESRRQGLEEYSKAHGVSSGSLDGQLGWMKEETSVGPGMYTGLWDRVNQESSPVDAAKLWMDEFERPLASASHWEDRRKPDAEKYFSTYAQGQVSGNVGAKSPSSSSSIGGSSQKMGGLFGKIGEAINKALDSDYMKSVIKTLFGDRFNPFSSLMGGLFGGFGGIGGGSSSSSSSSGSSQVSAQSVSGGRQYAESMVGKPGFGNNGCTTFVREYLLAANSPLGQYMKDPSPIMDQVKLAEAECNEYPGDRGHFDLMWVPTLEHWAKQQGLWKDVSEGGAEGDVAVTMNGGHVVIADGKGGYWGNSSSTNTIVHSDSIAADYGDKTRGYIRTGSGSSTVSTSDSVRSEADMLADAGSSNVLMGMGKRQPIMEELESDGPFRKLLGDNFNDFHNLMKDDYISKAPTPSKYGAGNVDKDEITLEELNNDKTDLSKSIVEDTKLGITDEERKAIKNEPKFGKRKGYGLAKADTPSFTIPSSKPVLTNDELRFLGINLEELEQQRQREAQEAMQSLLPPSIDIPPEPVLNEPILDQSYEPQISDTIESAQTNELKYINNLDGPTTEDIAPNGMNFTQDDMDLMLSRGYDKERAIRALSSLDKYQPLDTARSDILPSFDSIVEQPPIVQEPPQVNINIEAMVAAQTETNRLLSVMIELMQAQAQPSSNTMPIDPNVEKIANDRSAQNIRNVLSAMGNGSSLGMGDQFGNPRDAIGDFNNIMKAMDYVSRR